MNRHSPVTTVPSPAEKPAVHASAEERAARRLSCILVALVYGVVLLYAVLGGK